MTLLVLFILAVIWAAVLLPPWLQSRSENRPADSITSFRNQLSVLERRAGRAPAPRPPVRHAAGGLHSSSLNRRPVGRPAAPIGRPGISSGVALSRAEVRRRRRDVLSVLCVAAGFTLLLGVFIGGPMLLVHLLVDMLLVGYVAALARAQRIAAEREMKVRYLPERSRVPEPAFLLRSTGN